MHSIHTKSIHSWQNNTVLMPHAISKQSITHKLWVMLCLLFCLQAQNRHTLLNVDQVLDIVHTFNKGKLFVFLSALASHTVHLQLQFISADFDSM